MPDNTQTDLLVAAGAISAPMWLEPLNAWITLILGIGGLFLLGLRIWRNLKHQDDV